MPGTEPTTTERQACPLSEAKCAFLALQLRRACGVGRMLLAGDVPAKLVTELLSSNMDMFVCRDGCATTGDESLDEQFDKSRILSPDEIGATWFDDVVIIRSGVAPESSDARWIASLGARARRSLALVLTAAAINRRQRHDWERAIVPLGFRKHPMLGVLAPYDMLDQPTELLMLLFEPLPPGVREGLPVADARAATGVGDETRQTGYRSDALLARYGLATLFVRPGDQVVDIGGGLGEGAYVLASASRAAGVLALVANEAAVGYAEDNFVSCSHGMLAVAEAVAGASAFRSLASESVDFAVWGEELGSLDEADSLLSELRRVLTPGGRAWITVPTRELTSEAEAAGASLGHGYDWCELAGQLAKAGFYLDRAWMQVEGGANRPLGEASATLVEFSPYSGPAAAGDWIMVLVMAPLQAGERMKAEPQEVPNIVAFARDYENPWLVRGLVSMGLRATSVRVLEDIASDILKQAGSEQADYGAALCVLCYRALDTCGAREDKYNLARQALKYTETQARNPAVLRWQVSLAFAAALLYNRLGDRVAAKAALERVTAFDVLQFSPLLGTKTVAAAFSLGEMELAAGKVADAKRWWTHAVAEARRLVAADRWEEVVGDPRHLQTFGMPELASVLLLASKAVNGLRSLQEAPGRPGVGWQLTHATPDELVKSKEVERRVTDEWMVALQAGKQWIERKSSEQEEVISELSSAKQWLDEQYRTLRDEISRLNESNNALLVANDWALDQARGLGREVSALRNANSALTEAKEWLEGQYRTLCDEVARLNGSNNALLAEAALMMEQVRALELEVQTLREANASPVEARERAEGQQAEQSEVLSGAKGELGGQYSALRREDEALAIAKDWLEGQYHALLSQNDALSTAKDWLEGQYHALLSQNDALSTAKDWLDIQYHSLLRENEALVTAKDWLDVQYHSLSDEVSRLTLVRDEIASYCDGREEKYLALANEHSRLQGVLDEHQNSNTALSAKNRLLEAAKVELSSACHALQSANEELDSQCRSLRAANAELKTRLERTIPGRARRILRRLRAALWTRR